MMQLFAGAVMVLIVFWIGVQAFGSTTDPNVVNYPNVDPDVEIISTGSGLQYQDIVVGTGSLATAGQTVSVHYTGWLTDGRKFDSSVDRGTPFEFPLGTGGVIQGWDEGVAGMRVGGKRILIIPPALGYGDRASSAIPAGSTLIFEVELLGIVE